MAGKKFTTLGPIIDRINRLKTALAIEGAQRLELTLYRLAYASILARRNPRGKPWPAFRDQGAPAKMPARALSSLRKERLDKTIYLDVNFPSAKANQGGARHIGRHNGQKLTSVSVRLLSKEQVNGITRDDWRLPARNMLPGKGGKGGELGANTKLPPKWRDAIDADLRAAFGEIWGSR